MTSFGSSMGDGSMTGSGERAAAAGMATANSSSMASGQGCGEKYCVGGSARTGFMDGDGDADADVEEAGVSSSHTTGRIPDGWAMGFE